MSNTASPYGTANRMERQTQWRRRAGLVFLFTATLLTILLSPSLAFSVTPRGYKKPPKKVLELIHQKAVSYKIDAIILESLIRWESSFDEKAKGKDTKPRKGVPAVENYSLGLGQIKLSTAKGLGYVATEKELYYPYVNIEYTAKYLRKLMEEYGQYEKALSAYNAGHLTTANQKYVKRIMDYARDLKQMRAD